jgi:hypothetical protein
MPLLRFVSTLELNWCAMCLVGQRRLPMPASDPSTFNLGLADGESFPPGSFQPKTRGQGWRVGVRQGCKGRSQEARPPLARWTFHEVRCAPMPDFAPA